MCCSSVRVPKCHHHLQTSETSIESIHPRTASHSGVGNGKCSALVGRASTAQLPSMKRTAGREQERERETERLSKYGKYASCHRVQWLHRGRLAVECALPHYVLLLGTTWVTNCCTRSLHPHSSTHLKTHLANCHPDASRARPTNVSLCSVRLPTFIFDLPLTESRMYDGWWCASLYVWSLYILFMKNHFRFNQFTSRRFCVELWKRFIAHYT